MIIQYYHVTYIMYLGGVYKLHLQKKKANGQKNQLFLNFYTVENVGGGQKKPNLVNAVCERLLRHPLATIDVVQSHFPALKH